MASFNRVILIGNLTRDVELRYLQSGMAVTDIGLAVNEKYKNSNGEWIEEVTFVDVTVWGRTAEVMSEYLSKGSPVFIEGRLKLDSWEKDGQKRSKLKVVCEKMQLIGAVARAVKAGKADRSGRARRGGPAGAATQPGFPIQPSAAAGRRIRPRTGGAFRRRRYSVLAFCRSGFPDPFPQNWADLEIRPSTRERIKHGQHQVESTSSPSNEASAEGSRTEVSNCCWCSPSNTWANRGTWSR